MTDFPFELQLDGIRTMYRTRSRLFIELKDRKYAHRVERLIALFDLVLEKGVNSAAFAPLPGLEEANHTDKRLWVKSMNNNAIFAENVRTMESAMRSYLAWIAPVYRIDGPAFEQEYYCPLPNVFMIKPHSDVTVERLWELFAKYGIKESAGDQKGNAGHLYCSIADPKLHSSYKIASILQYMADVRFEWVPMGVPAAASRHSGMARYSVSK